MSTVSITFDTDNAAFAENDLEVWAVLERTARALHRDAALTSPGSSGSVFDSNGNRIGRWSVSGTDA
jgi:hypothetical protein